MSQRHVGAVRVLALTLAGIFLVFSAVSVQESAPAGAPPCSAPGFAQFDFWLGDWDLSWAGGQGANRITRVLDDRVILEEFDGSPSMRLWGMSVSTYSPGEDLWRQTWVENEGSYLDFEGGRVGEEMVLQRQGTRAGRAFRQRMVWTGIRPDSLTWRWERSEDDGDRWRTLWQIEYRRR